MGVTEQLCERVCATGYDDLTDAARTAARRLVLDGLAVAVAGSKQEASPGIVRSKGVGLCYAQGIECHKIWEPKHNVLQNQPLPVPRAI